MNTPQRIQLSRKRGWRMPPNTVKVDRTTKWGNPFPVVKNLPPARDFLDEAMRIQCATAEEAVRKFRNLIEGAGVLPDNTTRIADAAKVELRGKNLACWCKPGTPCHADVLLEIANNCQSDCDGHCEWSHCPQLRDGEPDKTGRHCPLDHRGEEGEA